MNLLARILSHGFALALVALIAVALMYRGELFPEWDLPEFLVIDDKSDAGQADTAADESHPQTGTLATRTRPAVEETTEEMPETVVVPPAAYPDSRVASEPATVSPVTPSANEMLDEDVQEAAVVSDTGVEEPLDPVQEEPDSGGQAEQAEADSAGQADQAEPDSAGQADQAEPDSAGQADQTEADSAGHADQAEADSAGQAALGYQAVDSGAVVSGTPVVEEAPQQTDAVTPAAESASAPLEHQAVESGAVVSGTPVIEEAPQQVDAVTSAAEAASAPDAAPVQQQTEQQLAPVAEDNAKQVAPEPEPVDSEPGVAATTPEPVIPDEPAPQAEPSQPPASTPPSLLSDLPAETVDSSKAKTAYELLAAAREAYWLRDYKGAEKHYLQLIEVEPDNPDGYGELGNMYFAQGQWEQAAAAYYDAGVRMINEGMVVQARQLVDVIRGLNGGQADELEKQVDAASQNTP
ncbi:MAG: hypothetical protein OEU63_07920 [Gammaproteobacteria bacterium]|nr:hypothetical protein [Gammaproteobacteria bacterium]